MKITSKSILSPGRSNNSNSLTTSLSRKLRNSGSIKKGGASPAMFPAKKRGTFESQQQQEPSSPKVTCIGQVRVKSKKKQHQKALSRRHSTGEISFEKLDSTSSSFNQTLHIGQKGTQICNQNQNPECSRSWVHFPVTVCDALRAFGSEFSCLFPCRTDRDSTNKEKMVVSSEDSNGQGSCGAVFARWLVAVEGGERDIEMVVGDCEEDDGYEDEGVVRKRRHVFEDLEIVNDRVEGVKDGARVSICVPPKNALLLMRCRSDPVMIEALNNRSWEPSVGGGGNDVDEDEFEDAIGNGNDNEYEIRDLETVVHNKVMVLDQDDEANEYQDCYNVQQNEVGQDLNQENVQQAEVGLDYYDNVEHRVMILDQDQENVQKDDMGQNEDQENMQKDDMGQNEDQENTQKDDMGQNEDQENRQKDDMGQNEDQENMQKDDMGQNEDQENMQKDDMGQNEDQESMQKDDMGESQNLENVKKSGMGQDQEKEQTEEESLYLASLFQEIVNQDYESQQTHEEKSVEEPKESNNEVVEIENDAKEVKKPEKTLPECLLLMMYEPKLSMEVSKETWVCSQDFIRRNPSRKKPPPAPAPPTLTVAENESNSGGFTTINDVLRVADGGFPATLPQPARSSCSLPAAPSMATVLGQKLADAVGYEPFVLTRCKSEPMKTAAAKLLPESCVWENRKLDRLSRASFGFGSARLGF
nr:hypothetical protein [Tanacetum cinerariifolium]GEX44466.1 hypothetical protein [Tanacetum cinerariifolium]